MLRAAIWNHLLLAMLALAASNAKAREPYRESLGPGAAEADAGGDM
jgi:hypothetical protein